MLSVAIPEPSLTAVPAAVPFSVKVMALPPNGAPAEVSVAMSFAVPPNAPEPPTALIAVAALLVVVVVVVVVVGGVVVLGGAVVVVDVIVVTSNASTHTQFPQEAEFFVPVTSISSVYAP